MNNHTQKKVLKQITLLLAIVLNLNISLAQISSSTNIKIPESSSDIIVDVLCKDSKVFYYSPQGISIYNEVNNDFVGKVGFDNWGKFNIFYFNPGLFPGEYNTMTYNDQYNILYTVTPDMNIEAIYYYDDPDPNGDDGYIGISIDPIVSTSGGETLSSFLTTLNGRMKIEYDNNNSRLYIMGSSRDPNYNCTGQFHTSKNLFCIYDVDNTKQPDEEGYLNLIFSDLYEWNGSNNNNSNYKDQVTNFAFNYNPNKQYFYLVRLGRFEIWEIPAGTDPIRTIYVDQDYYSQNHYYKFGKILSFFDSSINLNKIVIVPYRRPLDGNSTFEGYCYIIDGNSTNDIQELYAPSKTVLDVEYMESSHDLIMSYLPNDDIQPTPNGVEGGSDISIYRYDGSSYDFEYCFTTDIEPSLNDTNSSFNILVAPNNKVFINKKDQIVKLSYNSSDGSYSVTNDYLIAENNFFGKGSVGNSKSFIINRVSGKIEVIDNSTYNEPIGFKTGHTIYHIEPNLSGNNLYLYNKLNYSNPGIYSFDPDDNTTQLIEISKPVGDVVFNKFTNQFLVSQIDGQSAIIKKFNGYDNTDEGQFLIENNSYVKDMFISDNGYLYILTKMRFDSGPPEIHIYDASDYSLVTSFTISNITSNDLFQNYNAHFAQEKEKVFLTVYPQELTKPPYNTEANNMFDIHASTGDNQGKLLVFDEQNLSSALDSETINFPGKVITPCREIYGGTSRFEGNIFIIGKYFQVYNTITGELNSLGQFNFIDITYNQFYDKIFAFSNYHDPTCSQNVSCKMFEIDINDNQINVVELSEFAPVPGQASAFFSNPYNGKVYIQQKVDNAKLGGSESTLYSFDPGSTNYKWETTTLGFTTFAPLHDQTGDPQRSYYYNMTTPYINPATNSIYLPNGSHSSISKVGFDANEILTINNDSWSWLSFPRLEREDNNAVNVNYVLIDNIEPNDPYSYYYKEFSSIVNLPLNGSNETFAEYNGSDSWIPDEFFPLSQIQSSLGYKLNLDYNETPPYKQIHLYGDVLEEDYHENIYGDKENWIGYWLYEEQDIFDALADFEDDLYIIKLQNNTCVRMESPEGPVPQEPPFPFVCEKENHNIKYGDMAVLVPYFNHNTIGDQFYWNSSANPPSEKTEEQTEYFTYTETDDYTPYYIELDSTENPLELGVMIGDSCVGATTVYPEDTVIVLRAYTNISNDSVVFEEYFGTKSISNSKIKGYNVLNRNTYLYEKRTIKTAERQPVYYISFREKLQNKYESNKLSLEVFPNPAKGKVTIGYIVNKPAHVNLSVYDLLGKKVCQIVDADQTAGNYNVNLELHSISSESKGMFFIHLKLLTTDGEKHFSVKKVIIQ